MVRTALATAALVLLATACGGGEPVAGAAPEQPTAISIKDFTFTPETFTVKVGTEIRFENADNQAHTATSDTPGVFNTDTIAAASSSTPVTIAAPGTYAYHCSFHPFMKATITVQ